MTHFNNSYRQCQLCPRRCQIDRTKNQTGFCGESAQLRVALIEPHFGEEPPISGTFGSGTVFFSGCSLKCCYCQNYRISTNGHGEIVSVESVVKRIEQLYHTRKIHNVNFVTPDHFFPHCIEIVEMLRSRKIEIPTVFNLSGYQNIEQIQALDSYGDIYLVDYKYADSQIAQNLSQAADYPVVALNAIGEMVKQKGFLNSFVDEISTFPIASKGVLVRHLIIPGQIQNSIDALTSLFLEFGANLPLSLMSQYTPVTQFSRFKYLDRQITPREFEMVYNHLQELGFNNLFVQYPPAEITHSASKPFLPDFTQERPFEGNIAEGEEGKKNLA